MAVVIEQLANIINILDDSKLAGQQIIDSIPLNAVAIIDRNTAPIEDAVVFDTPEGIKGSSVKFDGNIYVHPLGGSKTLFVGGVEDLVNLLNTTYFVDSTTIAGTFPPASIGTLTPTVNNGVEVTSNDAFLVAAMNANRKELKVHVELFDAWIREISELTDPTTRKGVKVQAGDTYVINTDGGYIYTGAVSIINANDGEKPFFYVTESI
jgi:hypothetical protein